MDLTLFAHTGSSLDDESTWQLLEDHLLAVADRASAFAGEFGAGAWGRAVGILHDAGKASCAFQQRLHGSDTHVDHSTAGAKVALDCYGDIAGRMMAYICSGHHAGLPNGIVRSRGEIPGILTPLEERLAASVEPYDGFSDLLDSSDCLALPAIAELEPMPAPRQLSKPENAKRAQRFSAYAFARMLYSSLVDADYLDTERFMAPEIARVRVSRECSDVSHLLDQLLETLGQIASEDTPVNRARQTVLADCLAASEEEPGLFSLTVPTGGGKTLSSLAFALAHAKRYDMNRVIIAIPFTSIVEQTAAVLKGIFGPDAVLEHHSGYDFSDLDDEAGYAQRLATQNWDAPIVVTTNVQLLESFFANKPAKSRKVHNFVKSVIILDEAQTLPDGLLSASLAALESLTFSYGSSVVLCTATQPALDLALPFGLCSSRDCGA